MVTTETFAWIELIPDTRMGPVSTDLIEKAEANFTPAIVLAEGV